MADKKAGTANTSRRAALRAQQEAEEKARRRRKIVGVVAGVLAIAIIIVIVAVAVGQGGKDKGDPSAQVTPPSAAKDGVITLNKDKVKSGAPTVTIYQDYQCPACKAAEDKMGKALNELSASGDIRLEYHTLTFLDQNLHNDSSSRAAMAAAAADLVGHYEAYHDTIYANQPTEEGQGYTDDQLRNTFATQAGITGDDLTRFQKIYDNKQTSQYVKDTNDSGMKTLQGFGSSVGTPTYVVNGKQWDGWGDLTEVTPESLLKAIKAAA